MEEESSVSFTTASGKEVAFKAKRGRPKASAKKVVETPVTPQEEEPPVEAAPVEAAPVEAAPVEPAPVEPAPVEAPTEPAKIKAPRRKAAPKAAKPAPGIPERLPKKTRIERPPELPTQEALAPEPEPQRFSREDMHSMIHEYMVSNKRNARDARINMYRSWLTA